MNLDPQLLHNRAAESAKETRQMLTTMSTGSLAVFFLALTSNEHPIKPDEKIVVLIALFLMAIAVFSGVYCAYSDAQWSYNWAKELEGNSCQKVVKRYELKKIFWHNQKRWSEKATMIFFVLGVLSSCFFIGQRTLQAGSGVQLKPSKVTHMIVEQSKQVKPN